MASYALFCFAFLALISQQIPVDADVIATICEKSKVKETCQSIFAAHPEAKNADISALAIVALDEAIKQAKDIQLKIKKLSKSSGESNTKKNLNDCSKLYGESIVALEESKKTLESKKALESKKLLHVNLWTLFAADAGQKCERGFTEEAFGASPLTKMNNKYDDICSIILTITSELPGAHA